MDKRAWLILLLPVLAGCAVEPQQEPPSPARPATLEQRLEDLAAKTEDLSTRPMSAAEIQGRIHALETERNQLLTRYTGEHPRVLLLEQQIQHLRDQLSTPTRIDGR